MIWEEASRSRTSSSCTMNTWRDSGCSSSSLPGTTGPGSAGYASCWKLTCRAHGGLSRRSPHSQPSPAPQSQPHTAVLPAPFSQPSHLWRGNGTPRHSRGQTPVRSSPAPLHRYGCQSCLLYNPSSPSAVSPPQPPLAPGLPLPFPEHPPPTPAHPLQPLLLPPRGTFVKCSPAHPTPADSSLRPGQAVLFLQAHPRPLPLMCGTLASLPLTDQSLPQPQALGPAFSLHHSALSSAPWPVWSPRRPCHPSEALLSTSALASWGVGLCRLALSMRPLTQHHFSGQPGLLSPSWTLGAAAHPVVLSAVPLVEPRTARGLQGLRSLPGVGSPASSPTAPLPSQRQSRRPPCWSQNMQGMLLACSPRAVPSA